MTKPLIKLMIIDDEYYIRQAIKVMLDWSSLGIEIAGEAENGIEALEKISLCKPDILLADIQMPGMDGLELARTLHYQHPNIKIIFLTGYDRFEFARQAMEYGVIGYLLKPVSRQKMVEQMTAAVKMIESANDQRNRMKSAEQYRMNACLNWLVFEDKKELPEEFQEEYQILQDEIAQGEVFVLLVRLPGQRLHLGIIREIDHLLRGVFGSIPARLFQCTENTFGILVSCHLQDAKIELSIWQDEMNTRYGEGLHGGISGEFSTITKLHDAYSQAWFALQESVFEPRSILLQYDVACKLCSSAMMPLYQLRDKLLLALRGMQIDEVNGIITDCFRQLQDSYRSFHNLYNLVGELFAIARIYGEEEALPTTELGHGGQQEFLDTFAYIEEIRLWFIDFFEHLFEKKSGEKRSPQVQLVRQIKEELDQHFSEENCTIESIASKLGYNATYCSNVFKKMTGLSVVQYITKCRMEKARELLKSSPNVRLSEVSSQVGYSDVFYFSRRFKQYFGVSPSEYH